MTPPKPKEHGAPPLDDETCWKAVVARDPGYDHRFLFGVLTTGIYCRPSCAARRPLRRNVRFYFEAEAARRDGLRACRRCRPDEPSVAERMQELCDYIRRESDSGVALSLSALAKRACLSPSHLQRVFRATVGVSPREFVEDCRMQALKRGLKRGTRVTDAIYDAGFGASSRVYERVDSRLGMTPREYRAGGKGVEISYAFLSTRVGHMLLAATDRGLCCVQFGDSQAALLAELQREFPAAKLTAASRSAQSALTPWADALRRHLAAGEPLPELPLDLRASAFRLKVWRYLQTIPRGATSSYAEVARAIGEPRAVRAVGSACAANPVAIVVPCHRVLRSDGALSGYRWGIERKRKLLAFEAKPAKRAANGGTRRPLPNLRSAR